MSHRKTKIETLLLNIEVIKELLKNLYTISEQLRYISTNSNNNFSVSDTTYTKFLNEYLPKEFDQHKKNQYFVAKITQIKQVIKDHPLTEVQFKKLNFSGLINGNTRLNLTIDDYIHFIIRYYKNYER